MNDKCRECPWKNNVTSCMEAICELHDEEPLCHFIDKINSLERDVTYYSTGVYE